MPFVADVIIRPGYIKICLLKIHRVIKQNIDCCCREIIVNLNFKIMLRYTNIDT